MPKKSLYYFLSALLGALMFLILHRLLVFFFLYMLAAGYIQTGLGYYQFLVLDYFSLIISILLGAWYGIWLGMYWYEKVYGAGGRGGFVSHLSGHIFSDQNDPKLQAKLEVIKERIEKDVWQLEDLAETAVEQAGEPATQRVEIKLKAKPAKPAKRKVVRKATVKKTNTSNLRKGRINE